MRGYIVQGAIEVRLSKRNLLSLLHKVDQDWSARTIFKDEVYLDGDLTDVRLVVVAEPDEMHYVDAPGVMHPETERFVQKSFDTL